MRGRRLAFDFGTARIGVAVCDADGLLATPLAALDAKRYKRAIAELIAEYQPIALYVGDPRHLSGAQSSSSEKAAAFAEELKEFGIPVLLVDERMTTRAASRELSAAGISRKDQKKLIDSASAVAILELGMAKESQ